MTKKIILMIMLWGVGICYAQDSTQSQLDALKNEISALKKGEKTHFMIRGSAQFGLDASSDNVNFNMTSFSPIFLWRLGDRLLFESEVEMEYMDNQFDLMLHYANVSYIVTKGLTVKVGQILIPFGVFGEKLHPAWINKFTDAPLGLGHDNGMLPMSDMGVEIRGGLQLGPSKLSYALYAVNGPRIMDGTSGQTQAGMLTYENTTDNNKNKAIGGRLGILPLSNSSLEIGFSGYYAKPGAATSPFAGDSVNMDINYKDVTAMLTAVDLSYTRMIAPLKGILDIKAQYNMANVSDAIYLNPNDTNRMTNRYNFKNNSTAYYAQLAYRPVMLDNKVLKNIEIVGRYSVYNTPTGSLWESTQSQVTIGLNYWFSWRTVLKLDYQMNDGVISDMGSMSGMSGMVSNSSMSMPGTVNTFQIHLATGL